jgi:hypothetical protein
MTGANRCIKTARPPMTETTPREPQRGKSIGLIVGLLALAGGLGFLVLSLAPKNVEFTMESVVSDVYQRFPEVEQVTADDVAARLASATPPLLLDVRDEAEFNVSHLAGATRVAPAR